MVYSMAIQQHASSTGGGYIGNVYTMQTSPGSLGVWVGRYGFDFDAVFLLDPLASSLLISRGIYSYFSQHSVCKSKRLSPTSALADFGNCFLQRPPPVFSQLLFPFILVHLGVLG